MTLSNEKIVEVSDVSLAYRRTRHRVSSLKQTAIDTIKRRMAYEQFFALNGVSFDIARVKQFRLLVATAPVNPRCSKLLHEFCRQLLDE